jgi:hypothetical protein
VRLHVGIPKHDSTQIADIAHAAAGKGAAYALFQAASALLLLAAAARGAPGLVAVNAIGALSVAFTLVVNLGRGYPLLSLAATALIAFGLYALWRPTGVEELKRIGESDE